MPRANGGSESVEKTRAWRKRMRAARRPETDAVDAALAAAVAVYYHTAASSSSDRDRRRALALELMSVNFLVSRGYDLAEADRQVRSRVRRLDVERLIPLVNGTPS